MSYLSIRNLRLAILNETKLNFQIQKKINLQIYIKLTTLTCLPPDEEVELDGLVVSTDGLVMLTTGVLLEDFDTSPFTMTSPETSLVPLKKWFHFYYHLYILVSTIN